jgi:hypothetical protein
VNPETAAALEAAGDAFHRAAEYADDPHSSHVYDVMAYHAKMLVYTTQDADPEDREPTTQADLDQ